MSAKNKKVFLELCILGLYTKKRVFVIIITMTEMESPKIPQEDRTGIEERFSLKKTESAEAGNEFAPGDAAKEAVREYSQNLPRASEDSQTPHQKAAAKLKKEPHAVQIDELLKIAEKDGLARAVNVARHLGNPHILDDFHDRLALEFLKNK